MWRSCGGNPTWIRRPSLTALVSAGVGCENGVMADYPENPRRQFAAAWRSATDAVDQWRKQVTAATSEAIDKLDPAVRSAIEAARAAVAGHWGACECPCATAHPQDQGVCDGRAVMTRRLGGTSRPTCAPCAVAQGVAEMRR
jgi:hypothetical protein